MRVKISLFFCLFLACLVAQAQAFEGKISFLRTTTIDSSTQTKTVAIYAKMQKVRIDFLADENATTPYISRIADGETKEIAVLSHLYGENNALKTKLKPLEPAFGCSTRADSTQKMEILGYNCIQVTTQTPEAKIVSWIAPIAIDYNRLIAVFMGMNEGLLPQNALGIPLKTTIYETQTSRITQITATKVEPQPLAAFLFEIPPHYQLKTMAE